WAYAYGADGSERTYALDDTTDPAARDRRAERELQVRATRIVERWWPLLDRTGMLAADGTLRGMDAVAFSQDALAVLRGDDDIEVDVAGGAPTYEEADSTPLVHVSATGDDASTDWFDLHVTVTVGDEEVPFESLFAALARGDTHLILDSGTYFRIDDPDLDRLRRLIDEARALQEHPSDQLRVSPYQAGLWGELVELGVVGEQSKRWQSRVSGLLDLDSIPPPALPAGLDATMRPYQRDGYAWLSFLWDQQLGGVLADDMGLGKTLQALAMVARAKESGRLDAPVVVVAPTSVVPNWVRECARFAPGLEVVAVTETKSRRGVDLSDVVAGADLIVTSYALFRLEFDAYDALDWSGLVLDEAQFVKNHQAKTYGCARRLRTPFKLAITGTPLENSLMDLWSMLSIVAPGLFPNPERFKEHFRNPIERGKDSDVLATLRRRVRPLIRRRTKELVAADLPPKQEQVLEVALSPQHRRIYQTHLQRERQKILGLLDEPDQHRFTILRSLTLLRQLSLDPYLVDDEHADVRSGKVDTLLEQLREVIGEGHRALVFSQFTRFLGRVRQRLDDEGIAYAYLDGATRDRGAAIDEFKSGRASVFLISL
ncbi:MAG: DEAD/DEAH box helicase, partial [Actinomycetia bacterium]|nr:DEAD/DEAH box helicase [Actinomycetes bacterium]